MDFFNLSAHNTKMSTKTNALFILETANLNQL